MSMLINVMPTKPFKMERGLRQSDPLLPFLFVLVAEVLNRLITIAIDKGFIETMKVGKKNIVLLHLQFAYDTIIFCPQSEVSVRNYRL